MKETQRINRQSWHARLAIWGGWMAGSFFQPKQTPNSFSDYRRHPPRFTTCSYIRCAFIWSWLIPLVAQILPLGYFGYAFIYSPMQTVGMGNYLHGVLVVVAIIVIIIGIIAAIWGMDVAMKALRRRQIRKEREWLSRPVPIVEEEKPMSIWQIARQWIKDRHDRVCSFIEFSDPEERRKSILLHQNPNVVE